MVFEVGFLILEGMGKCLYLRVVSQYKTRQMKRIILYLIFSVVPFLSIAQTDKKPFENLTGQTIMSVPFRLFPTQNMWTFLKLDTRNGKIWQVQFSMKTEGRFETHLNLISLLNKEKEVNDRFTLYPTQNIYTFILLDQIEGKTWQVQWSSEQENRTIIPIE